MLAVRRLRISAVAPTLSSSVSLLPSSPSTAAILSHSFRQQSRAYTLRVVSSRQRPKVALKRNVNDHSNSSNNNNKNNNNSNNSSAGTTATSNKPIGDSSSSLPTVDAAQRLQLGLKLIDESLAEDDKPDAAGNAMAMLDRLRQSFCFPDVDVYNRVIAAFVKRGDVSNALACYEKLRADNVAPNECTFSLLLERREIRDRRPSLVSDMKQFDVQSFELFSLGATVRDDERADAHIGAGIGSSSSATTTTNTTSSRSGDSSTPLSMRLTNDNDATTPNNDDSVESVSSSQPQQQQNFWTTQTRLYEQQRDLELRAITSAVERYQQMLSDVTSIGKGAAMRPAQQVLLRWFEPLTRAVQEMQKKMRKDATLAAAIKEIAEENDPKNSKMDRTKSKTSANELGGDSSSSTTAIDGEHFDDAKSNNTNNNNNYQELLEATEIDRTAAPYLLLLPPQSLAVITMHELLGLLLNRTTGVPFVTVAMEIGRAVQAEVNVSKLSTKQKSNFDAMKQFSNQYESINEWPRSVLVKIGASLIRLALDHCRIYKDLSLYEKPLDPSTLIVSSNRHNQDETLPKLKNLRKVSSNKKKQEISDHIETPHDDIDEHTQQQHLDETEANENDNNSIDAPAFTHVYRIEKGKRRGYIMTHKNVYWLIESGHRVRETFHARHLPMVVRPVDWTHTDRGGYLHSSTFIMRTRGSALQKQALKPAHLDLVYDALNALGATPWCINLKVFDVAQRAWSSGGGIADLPRRTDDPVPATPPNFNQLSFQEKRQLYLAQRLAQKTNAELHSLRCDTMLKLQVADELKHGALFLPHNLDFRGRAYPIPPHLSHVGSDLCRGLLMFDEALPLGEIGLRWLKIHLANVFGMNKMSFDERVAWTERNLENARNSALQPLDGDRWWLNGEDPWQTLATCIELTDALSSPDPLKFMSHLPVHQDGTCNGLQHYAALGGDRFGAKQVNLEPSDRPQDVYSGVAELVRARVANDAQNGLPLAIKLNGRVDRKIVKQTVMTSVYGVTFVGANRQIQSRLRDVNLVADDQMQAAGTYLTKLTFDSLREMFLGARNIMEWLGLRVVQPYRRVGATQQVRTLVQTVVLAGKDDDLPVNVMRQQSAFPPNYVHSLDSTHMLLTARACRDAGITFASVHDSFWTHAATVPTMAHLLRREFVELHRQPLLHHLRAQLQNANPDIHYPPVPERGDLDLSCVLSSPYFFS